MEQESSLEICQELETIRPRDTGVREGVEKDSDRWKERKVVERGMDR